ncbi:MAG: phenylalanine--tRNA ligase subunit beta [Candidatus Omnitrophica bacterium]|nr:phenylalanine--tRNA ligase subunit beta [Candidatus Omnitrophota bacterium]
MRISYSWLKEYINFSAKPKDLADKLTMAGLEIKGVDEKDGDFIYEAEVTSNRPDWLCLYGIAREIQALYGSRLKPVKAALPKSARPGKPSITIEDKKGCARYVGIAIDGIRPAASSKGLAQKIENAGMRQVNNVADITNFCMFESGQPLHAFDYDKLDGGKIIVRRARKGEEIITIDGVKRALDENILVIADAKRPVAIAGIMGGRDTEVGFSTKKVLLESAYFDPALIRRAAKRLGISSEASYRFERNVDIGGCLAAAERAASLICEAAKAKSISNPSDVGAKGPGEIKITLRMSRANKVLGTDISASKCASILKSLGLGVKSKGKDALTISVPSFRRDLREEVDLIEEISRIYGYDNIPETLSRIQLWGKGPQKSRDRIIEEAVREALTGAGLNEAITYSLRCKDLFVQQALSMTDSQVLKVQNPLSSESEALRPVLICGMLDVVAYNLNRKVPDVKIFEIGKSYFYKGGDVPSEKGVLALAMCGMKEKNWHRKEAVDIFDLKGIIEALFSKLGIAGYEFEVKPLPLFSPAASAVVKINGKEIGVLGKVDKAFLDRYDIKGNVFVSELALEAVYSHAGLEHKFSGLPRYPSSSRDISLIVDDKVSNKDIVGTIKEACGDLAVDVSPFDLYRGEQVPKGCKSILYSVEYRAPDRTLTDGEVNSLDRKVREALVQRFNAKIR